LFFIKILNRFNRYFKRGRYLLEQGSVNRFLLLQKGDLLLVPVIAQVSGKCILLYTQHFAEAFHVAAFVYTMVDFGILRHREKFSFKREVTEKYPVRYR